MITDIVVSEAIVIYAVKYALEKRYGAIIVCDMLKRNWCLLREVNKEMIKKEIAKEILNRKEWESDNNIWEEILKL
jgi:hypothetical protein